MYWKANSTDAAGHVIDEQLGNGLHSYSAFDAVDGLLRSRVTGAAGLVQNLAYNWDRVGNLTHREDLNQALAEDFTMDNLNRLTDSRLTVGSTQTTNLHLVYDATGNITSKSDVGTYLYPASGSTSVRPHAVSSAGGQSYAYDANGNMTGGAGKTMTWFSYNLPNLITKGTSSSQFFYGAGRGRYKQIAIAGAGGSLPAGTETTVYVGGLFEKVTKPTGVIEYKHYISAGGDPVAMRTLRTNGVNDTRYLHKDHLGSVDTITDEFGAVVLRLSFDAFGKRRGSAWSGTPSGSDWTNIAATTHRGFTYHEQLDTVDLVHMNGRVYDPTLGRFISADPTVQAPFMSQSLNRYSYVLNNPLSMIDPSGFNFLSSAWHSIKHFFSKYGRMIAAVVIAIYAPYLLTTYLGMSEFAAAVVPGMLAGGVATGTWQGALLGGIAAGIGYAAGNLAAGGSFGEPGSVGHAFVHAVAGCASASLGGGSCGRGALAAGFADYTAGQLQMARATESDANFISAIEKGSESGTTTTLTGGGFGEGYYAARNATINYVMGQKSQSRPVYKRSTSTRGGVPLPDNVKAALSPYFEGFVLGAIRTHEGIPGYVMGDPDAFTMNSDIYFAPGALDVDTASGIALIGHEVLHAQDFSRLGTFRMGASYLSQYIVGRLGGLAADDAYLNISFERDAFALQARIRSDLIQQGFPP